MNRNKLKRHRKTKSGSQTENFNNHNRKTEKQNNLKNPDTLTEIYYHT